MLELVSPYTNDPQLLLRTWCARPAGLYGGNGECSVSFVILIYTVTSLSFIPFIYCLFKSNSLWRPTTAAVFVRSDAINCFLFGWRFSCIWWNIPTLMLNCFVVWRSHGAMRRRPFFVCQDFWAENCRSALNIGSWLRHWLGDFILDSWSFSIAS